MAAAALYLLLTKPMQKASLVTDQAKPTVPVAKDQNMQNEVEDVLAKVSKHILVNPAEAPYIATITNIDLVRQNNPVFYKDAVEGDKVLIWSDKAVVYSPSKDLIITMMTSIPPEVQANAASASVQSEAAAVEIRNGSRVAGAASRLKNALTGKDITVTSVGDAGALYDTTYIVDLTGGSAQKTVTAVLGSLPGAQVVSAVPDSEVATKAQILVIIGRDQQL